MPYNFVGERFHTKKLCRQTFFDILNGNGRFGVLSHTLGLRSNVLCWS